MTWFLVVYTVGTQVQWFFHVGSCDLLTYCFYHYFWKDLSFDEPDARDVDENFETREQSSGDCAAEIQEEPANQMV